MKKKLLVVLIFVSLIFSLSAKEKQKKLSERFHTDIGCAYSPSLSFGKEDSSSKTTFSNTIIINTEMSLEDLFIGLNIGTFGTFPYMIQIKDGNKVNNTSIQGNSMDGILGVSFGPTFTLYKNDLAVIKIAPGAKYSAEYITTPGAIDLTQRVGVNLDVNSRILGNDYINFLVGLNQSVNLYEMNTHETIDGKTKDKGFELSYDLMPYFGINLHF